ncbi:MAG TPA: antibiotic biosynthesis monooxygenase [Humidesulfovibrio sp.]|uniref:putative quinol monooxygenase n=1 Tax=Humidesulfovibrio sp. TaxID=2910988 RepID=UPI002C5198F8|nr:antibiotic biosynthesis monooxygenase [Humidesulfovibrio sp.]HWR03517.1 antibiotic biosynthesis monooxygenase [Humidesulfovibrio sp.]
MSEGKEITLLAEMTLNAPVDETVLGALQLLMTAVRQEPGCVEYAAHVHASDQRRIVFYERWASQKALDVHGAAPALAAWRATVGHRLAGDPKLTFWTRLG